MVHFAELDQEQLDQLDHLLAACKQVDGHSVPIYKHLLVRKRSPASNMLSFYEEQLCGFVGVYFFYEKGCEISLMVAPQQRKRGIATYLLGRILPLLEAHHMQEIVLPTPLNYHYTWFKEHGYQHKLSIYEMERYIGDVQSIATHNVLQVSLATLEDIPVLCKINDACFKEKNNMESRFLRLIQDPNYDILVASYNEHIIGKAHIHWHDQKARLTDFAILPAWQKRGFGNELLTYCAQHALHKGYLYMELEVEASNHSAIRLYQKYGFIIDNACDFWSISLDSLKQWLLAGKN